MCVGSGFVLFKNIHVNISSKSLFTLGITAMTNICDDEQR